MFGAYDIWRNPILSGTGYPNNGFFESCTHRNEKAGDDFSAAKTAKARFRARTGL